VRIDEQMPGVDAFLRRWSLRARAVQTADTDR
jgi:hypothetical protein